MSKKGQEMSVTTIILIVLGVLVLVFLVVGFTIGWSKILPFISPANNVKEIEQKCSLACMQSAKYDFCNSMRDVKVEAPLPGKLASLDTAFKATCYEIYTLTSLSTEKCPALIGECGTIDKIIYSSDIFANVACDAGAGSLAKTPQPYKFAVAGSTVAVDCTGTKA